MNYLPKNRSKSSLTKPILVLVGVFVLGATIFFFLGGVILSLASPLWKGENFATAKLSGVGDFFRTRNSLIKENAALSFRVSALELEIASRFSGPIEGDELFRILGRQMETGGIVATALVTPPQAPYDVIIIDAGSNEGVRVSERVFMAEGPLIGIISEVYPSSAKVDLYTAPGAKTNAILERHGVPVVLEGIGGGNFRVVLSRETEVVVGDRILSADVFSHLLGVVGDIRIEPTDSFKEVKAAGPANIFSVHFVQVRP